MALNTKLLVCDGRMLKRLATGGYVWLERNQARINQSNVFPVPDGDTGTNMCLTMWKAHEALQTLDNRHVGVVSAALAQGTLMGARGNSGVILSQLWRGFAEALDGRVAFDAPRFAHALRVAVDRAYHAVVEPVEGTILTVAREATEAVVEQSRHEPDLYVLLATMVEAAFESLERTPELLPTLKKAGVVDSGGQGLALMLEGMLRALQGEDLTISPGGVALSRGWEDALEAADEAGYGYDVQFLMRGEGFDVDGLRAGIDALGWSTLVVGDERLIKVHVHVHDPGEPISYAIRAGAELDDVVVENMQKQYEAYVGDRHRSDSGDRVPVDGVAVIAVAPGAGFRHLFLEELGAAQVIAGGQSMNPSTQAFVEALEALPHMEVILLPNNKNVILAAEQAAALTPGKRVRVVPSRSLPQGISAMLAYLNTRDVLDDVNAVATVMGAALHAVVSGEVTVATRNSEVDGIHIEEGQHIGLVDGRLVVAAAQAPDVLRGVLREANPEQHELVTVYYGEGLDSGAAQRQIDEVAADFPQLEFEIVPGGQPLYPYIISVE